MSNKQKLTKLQKKHQEELKEKRDAIKARKARTHRLIVRGAMVERALGDVEELSDEEFRSRLYSEINRNYIPKPIYQEDEEETQNPR